MHLRTLPRWKPSGGHAVGQTQCTLSMGTAPPQRAPEALYAKKMSHLRQAGPEVLCQLLACKVQPPHLRRLGGQLRSGRFLEGFVCRAEHSQPSALGSWCDWFLASGQQATARASATQCAVMHNRCAYHSSPQPAPRAQPQVPLTPGPSSCPPPAAAWPSVCPARPAAAPPPRPPPP